MFAKFGCASSVVGYKFQFSGECNIRKTYKSKQDKLATSINKEVAILN